MSRLYILVFICNVGQPICDQNTARVYRAFVAEPGMIVCGPAVTAPVIESAIAPDKSEYIRVRCELRVSG
jgi:hypothetical protein